jgi:MFS family permease
MLGAFSVVLTAYFVFIRRYVDDTGFGSVGLFFTTYVVVAILERLFFGWLPDRVGRKLVLYASMASLVAGFFVLSGTGSWVGVAVAGALCGAGHGFAFPILTAMVVDRAPDSDRGSAMSFFTALLDIGTLIGGPVFGAIIDAAGWDPMFFVAGVGLGAATVVFARWDRRVIAGSESEAATADRA